ncbi:MAG: hypothetical protein HUK21_13075 [Fibrobacteraceae bacterium]|nr:hypothetical protein [Fibrobacteraceae bacterium]
MINEDLFERDEDEKEFDYSEGKHEGKHEGEGHEGKHEGKDEDEHEEHEDGESEDSEKVLNYEHEHKGEGHGFEAKMNNILLHKLEGIILELPEGEFNRDTILSIIRGLAE